MKLRVTFVSISRLLLFIYVLLFIIYPLTYFVFYAVSPRSIFEVFSFLTSDLFVSSLRNSLLVSIVTTLLTLLIGIPYAYALHRYRIPGKKLILSATFLPTMIPPFVGALAFIFLLGRFGTLNLLLLNSNLIDRPINFIYGLHGAIIVQTITLFPWIAINIYNSLLKIDRTLEEAAESLGATPLRRFFTVTLPTLMPGVLTGVFLVLSFSFTDYATPIVIGQYQLLAPQAFTNIQQAIDETRVRTGVYMAFFMLLIVLAIFFAMKKYISIREYASLRLPKLIEEVSLKGIKKMVVYVYVYAVILIGLLPHMYVVLISLSKAWSFTPLPITLTLDNFQKILISSIPLSNTATYALVGTTICFLIGSIGAYVIMRTTHPLNSIIDSALSMMFVIPGIIIGISYMFAFRSTIPIMGYLGRIWLIMPFMLATRRITYTLRYSFATYITIRKSLEEAAYVLGERPLFVFLKLILPNAVYGILAGILFSFIEIINELTASLFLYKPGWETVTIQMFIEITAGQFPTSAAYAVLMLMVSFIAAIIAMRIAGRK